MRHSPLAKLAPFVIERRHIQPVLHLLTPRLATIANARCAVMLQGRPADAAGIEPWITRSWQRCLQRGQRAHESVGFDVISAATTRRSSEANRPLRRAAAPVLYDLSRVIASTGFFSILTDAQGVVVDVSGKPDFGLPAVRAIARIGVDLSERSVGTTAISAALTELQPVWLHRGEHFFEATSVYSCAGAPIFGPDGSCAGMLDLTGVHAQERPGLRDLVAQMAQRIEHALLLALPRAQLLQLQWPGPPSAASAALLVVDGDGRISGASRSACAMLGLHQDPAAQGFGALDDAFAASAGWLLGLRAGEPPRPIPLWSGLQVLVSAIGHDAGRGALLSQPPARLRDSETELIRRAVEAAQGNVAAAARQLGISRATVYRRLARRQRGSDRHRCPSPKTRP